MSITLNWKFAAAAAAFAFVLSVMAGLLGRVGFGTVVIRASVAALVFAGLGAGIELVLRRFLPELFGVDSGDGTGAHINIVVDDEQESNEPGSVGSNEQGTVGTASGANEDSEDDSFSEFENPEESLVQEVQEIRRSDSDQVAASESGAGSHDSPPEAEDDSIQEASEDSASGAAGVDDVDELPDIGSFAEDFSAVETSQVGESAAKQDGHSSTGDGQDPAMIARALQTMLRRETE